MKAVILAGGLGVRLRPFTEIIPKPLLPIGEKAVLEIQIEHLQRYGFDEIYLATNYKSDYIKNFFGDGKRFNVKLEISKEVEPLGTVGPISLIKDKLTEPFILMNGDILTSIDYSKFYYFALEKKDTNLVVGIKEIVTPFQFGNIFFEGDYVTGIQEKPNIKTHILAGIYILKPEIFNIIPNNQYFNMDTLILTMISKKMPILKYEINEYWLDIGCIEDYEKAQGIYNDYFKTEK
jgi:NDP-sugar pyrophosphorylase family protein